MFGMTNVKSISLPLASHYKLSDEESPKTVEEQHYMDDLLDVNIVGSILYVMVCMHPNKTYVLSIVS